MRSSRGRGSFCRRWRRSCRGVLVDVAVEDGGAEWVAEFLEGFGFDLTDAFAGDSQLVSDFLKGVVVSVDESVAEFQDQALAIAER